MTRQATPTTKSKTVKSFFLDSVGWSFAAALFTGLAAVTGLWALWLRTRDARLSAEKLAAYQAATSAEMALANARAEEAKGAAKSADARAEEAKKTAEGFKLDIAKANESAELARRDAELAKLEQEKLKSQLSWRAIPLSECQKMAAFLGSEKSSVTIAYVANDPEALYLAIQLAKVFEVAGWGTNIQSRTYPNSVLFGIFINGQGAPFSRVKGAFNAVGSGYSTDAVPEPMQATFVVSPAPPVLVMVGSKQPPSF